ncbi:MAG: hypothetical protein Kow0079_04490 [Vicingaceae bacterium]
MKIIATIVLLVLNGIAFAQTNNSNFEEKVDPIFKTSLNHPKYRINEGDSIVKTPTYTRVIKKEEVERLRAERRKNKINNAQVGNINTSEEKKERTNQPK